MYCVYQPKSYTHNANVTRAGICYSRIPKSLSLFIHSKENFATNKPTACASACGYRHAAIYKPLSIRPHKCTHNRRCAKTICLYTHRQNRSQAEDKSTATLAQMAIYSFLNKFLLFRNILRAWRLILLHT